MRVIYCIAILLLSLISLNAQASPHCGNLVRVYDYTDPENKTLLGTVEEYHFDSDVENLRPSHTGSIGGGISYTLMMFPNHYRALASLAKLSLRDKTLKPTHSRYSVECFFDRAIRYKPKDAAIRTIYGNYLVKAGQLDKAVEQLEYALSLQPENPAVNYNLGLIHVQKKKYEQARTYAKKAYELGFPLPGLKNKLMEAGKWED
jgi:tetratricopeptide (TPR) repeat protein